MLRCIFLNKLFWIELKVIPKIVIDIKSTLVQLMAWRWIFQFWFRINWTVLWCIYVSPCLYELNHCGQVIPKWRHSTRKILNLVRRLVSWRQQAIIWNKVVYSSMRFCGIHLRTISQEITKIHELWNYRFKITASSAKAQWVKNKGCSFHTTTIFN